MPSQKSKIYFLLAGLMIMGYLWIGIAFARGTGSAIMVCPVKTASGFPCPTCGSTRSVIKLLERDFVGAINANPFGLIVFIILLITPLWLTYDVLHKRDSLWRFYNKVESFVRKKKVAIFLIVVVIANWCWNISKGL